jgi:hypothetical protein
VESQPTTPMSAFTKPPVVTGLVQGTTVSNSTLSYTFNVVSVASDLTVTYVVGYVRK